MSKAVKKKSMTKTDKALERVMNDFRLFAKNFIKIIDNNGESVPFILNPEQEHFINHMEKFNICLKGRQIGMSTLIIALMLQKAVTMPDTNYIIMTQHAKVTQSLLTNLKRMYHSLPHGKYPTLFPKVKLTNRDGLSLDNGSRIQVATAGGEDSISGNTFQLIHLSEFAKYPENMQEEILSTAIPALAKSKRLSSICIESTAMGYNFFQELFMKAYRGRDSVWKPFFFSWLSKGYEKQFKVSFDEAETWFRLHNHGQRMSHDDLEWDETDLREIHKATYKQLMYRRYYIATNSLEKWNREFPISPEVAFSESNKSVFSTAKIAERTQYMIPPLPTIDVEDSFPDFLKKYINKKMFVYRLPKSKVKYYAGVDVASGSMGDFSVIQIVDEDGQQVLSYYSNDIPVYEFAEIINEVGRFYNYAHICVERNNVGLPTIERLRKEYGYQNMYKQKTFDVKGKKVLQLGFSTTNITKPILISDFKESFELNHILIEDSRTLDEMRIYIEENGRMGNIKGNGKHDDCVIAMALAVQAQKNNKYYVEI